jgi:hypothetical protein
MRRGVLSALLLAAALALAGCGDLGSGEVTERVQVPSLLTKSQVERYPEGSPARVVFGWWRALQFDNPMAASRYYDRSLRITPEKLDRQLQEGIRALGLDRRPRLVEVDKQGDRATVFLLLDASMRNPNGRVDVAGTARAFNLVREHGAWGLTENTYLERAARVSRAFAKALARRQDNSHP